MMGVGLLEGYNSLHPIDFQVFGLSEAFPDARVVRNQHPQSIKPNVDMQRRLCEYSTKIIV